VAARKVDHLHRWGEAMLMVKGLPAEVCQDCQEVYLPPASLRLLDDLVAKAGTPTEFLQIPVYSLP
jgi:YgiT-type zinc finger domain-containing protein